MGKKKVKNTMHCNSNVMSIRNKYMAFLRSLDNKVPKPIGNPACKQMAESNVSQKKDAQKMQETVVEPGLANGNLGNPELQNQVIEDPSLTKAHTSHQEPLINRGLKRPYIGSAVDGTPESILASNEPLEKRSRNSGDYHLNGDLPQSPQNDKLLVGKPESVNEDCNKNQISIVSPNTHSTKETDIYRMAIVTDNYPTTLFTLEQFDAIQMAIFEKLEITPDPLPIVNLGHINTAGVIPVACEGKNSVDFLLSFDGRIIKKKIKIKIVDAAIVPRPVKMAWESCNVVCRDLERVMRMLQRCNSGLRTALWRVIDTEQDAQSVRRIVYVDIVSAEYIKNQKYSIPDGLGRSYFKALDRSGHADSVGTSQQSKYYEKSKIIENSGSQVLEECPKVKEKLVPILPPGVDLDCSLCEVREPVVTVDLTEDSS